MRCAPKASDIGTEGVGVDIVDVEKPVHSEVWRLIGGRQAEPVVAWLQYLTRRKGRIEVGARWNGKAEIPVADDSRKLERAGRPQIIAIETDGDLIRSGWPVKDQVNS